MTRAHPAHAPSPAPAPGGLVAVGGRPLPLQRACLQVTAGAGHAVTLLKQSFHNPFPEPLEVTYQLPLPADGVVAGFSFLLDGRRVTARVEVRAQARARYEAALFEGRTAALLEHRRDDRFHQALGNLPPSATVDVEVVVEQPLHWEDGGWTWRFPTALGPLYTDDAADAATVPTNIADTPLPGRLTLDLHLTDTPTAPPWSPSHPIQVQGDRISLPAPARLDRDVIVRWPVAAPAVGATLQRGEAAGQAFLRLTLTPPSGTPSVVSRDLILLLDTSGSMHGAPLAQARSVAVALIEGLTPRDTLEIVTFGGVVRRMAPSAWPMTDDHKHAAITWLSALTAEGGTPMDEGIDAAMKGLRPDGQRQILLVTDGYIGFERRVLASIRSGVARAGRAGVRLHVLGIGSAVHRALTRPAARAGGGEEVLLAPAEPVGAAVQQLRQRMDGPVLTEVRAHLTDPTTGMRHTHVLPDLLREGPSSMVLAVPNGLLSGVLTVEGATAGGSWTQVLPLDTAHTCEGETAGSLGRAWAREEVARIEVEQAAGSYRSAESADAQVEALGLRFQIPTAHTSLIAVSERVTVDPRQVTRSIVQPGELPQGVSLDRLGLTSMGPLAAESAGPAAPPPPAWRPSPAPRIAPAPAGPPRAPSVPPDTRKRVAPDREKAEHAPPGDGGAAPKPGLLSRLLQAASGRGRAHRAAPHTPWVLVRQHAVRPAHGASGWSLTLELQAPAGTSSTAWDPTGPWKVRLADGRVLTAVAQTDAGTPARGVGGDVRVRLVLHIQVPDASPPEVVELLLTPPDNAEGGALLPFAHRP